MNNSLDKRLLNFHLHKAGHDINGNGEDYGAVIFSRDSVESLEIS